MLKLPVYLDYHATTPTDPRVVEAMTPYFSDRFGNASSRQHSFGWIARDAVELARRQLAALIGCHSREVYFTSGATESNNLALKGIVSASTKRRIHVVTVATEHRAVLDPCRVLQDLGVRVTVVQPDQDGLISVEVIKRAITAETVLITVMTANNEIGVMQPISKIGALARSHGIVFHTDAAQALGKVPFVVEDLSVDLASFSAHKIYGPKGVGALYVRRRANVPLLPLIDGGGHEQGLRSGTLNVPGIVGFGCAASICQSDLIDERKRTQMLRDRLLSGLEYRLERIRVNGSLKHRLPNNLNVAFAGLEGESLLAGLNDVAVSSGAACTSANPEASHVLKAIGVPDILARASLRFGLGRWTTSEEIDYVVDKVSSLVTRLRELSSITNDDQVH